MRQRPLKRLPSRRVLPIETPHSNYCQRGEGADEDERHEQERELVPVVVAERDHPHDDAERDARDPRWDEAARRVRDGEPRDEQRQSVGGVAAERNMVVMRELTDRREGDDRNRTGEEKRSQKKRLAPRKSLVLIGTMRTSLRELGASIIWPFPIAIETWPTTGLS
jgi:hypothetical protein